MSTAPAPLELIRWQQLPEAQRTTLRALRIDARQIEYAGTLDRALEVCESSDPADVAGLAICLAGLPVGFVVLRRGAKRPDWAPPGAVALTGMRIGQDHQGQGLGPRALRAVEQWLAAHWPDTRRVALTVDDENQRGKRAYWRAGYADYAKPQPGRIGLVRYLAKALASAPPVDIAPIDAPPAGAA